MPTNGNGQFDYPAMNWATAGMRKTGQALESSAKRQRKRMSIPDFDFSTLSDDELQQHHNMVGEELKRRQKGADSTASGS